MGHALRRTPEVAPKDEYVACELQTPVGWKLRAAKVVRVASKLRRIPGESERIPVELVTLRLTIAQPSAQARNVFVHTFTAVADGDHWAWILTPSKYELYRSNGCGVWTSSPARYGAIRSPRVPMPSTTTSTTLPGAMPSTSPHDGPAIRSPE